MPDEAYRLAAPQIAIFKGKIPFYKAIFQNFRACGALNSVFLPLIARRRRKFLKNSLHSSDFQGKNGTKTSEFQALLDGSAYLTPVSQATLSPDFQLA